MGRLLEFSFTRVLPGHGETFRADSPAAMREGPGKRVGFDEDAEMVAR